MGAVCDAKLVLVLAECQGLRAPTNTSGMLIPDNDNGGVWSDLGIGFWVLNVGGVRSGSIDFLDFLDFLDFCVQMFRFQFGLGSGWVGDAIHLLSDL